MRKFFLIITTIIVITVGSVFFGIMAYAADTDKKDPDLPKVGSAYIHEKSHYIVRGVGKKPFEYTATGESLVIIIKGIPGAMVIVPGKGENVHVDPTIPMVRIGGKEHNEFKTNSYLKRKGKNAIYLLLEYDRLKNQ